MLRGEVSRPVSIERRLHQRRLNQKKRAASLQNQIAALDVVYFVRGGDAVKIGTTENITKRFDALCAGSPVSLQLLGIVYGGVSVEHWCHFHCLRYRSHYEWFRWSRWTQSFVEWVLGHGDYAGQLLCLKQFNDDRLMRRNGNRQRSPSGAPLPQMRQERREAGDDVIGYREDRAARFETTPLGACQCELCTPRPWEHW